MDIPYQELSSATLTAVIEEFVLREGTDYGAQEYSLNDKVAQVRKQLEIGEVKINFDAGNQSCQIVSAID
jgi:uncharacterized protein YheU (UPF0270 family)